MTAQGDNVDRYPEDIAGTAALLESLAARDGSGLTEEFARRLGTEGAEALRRSADARRDRLRFAAPVPALNAPSHGLRLAASVAILGSVGAAWLATRAGHTSSSPANAAVAQRTVVTLDADEFAMLASALDDGAGSELDALFKDAAQLGDSVSRGWTTTDLADEGGAM